MLRNSPEVDLLLFSGTAQNWGMIPKAIPKIVTLCGSTRFKEEFEKAQEELTNQGCIVISVGRFGHRDGLDMDGELKRKLDELHFRKIDISDEIFVVNVEVSVCLDCGKPCELTDWCNSVCCGGEVERRPYVGESTRNEIEYTEKTGTPVTYLNPTD